MLSTWVTPLFYNYLVKLSVLLLFQMKSRKKSTLKQNAIANKLLKKASGISFCLHIAAVTFLEHVI